MNTTEIYEKYALEALATDCWRCGHTFGIHSGGDEGRCLNYLCGCPFFLWEHNKDKDCVYGGHPAVDGYF